MRHGGGSFSVKESYESYRPVIWESPDFKPSPRRSGPTSATGLIYAHAIINPYARIGDNVFIGSGANISHHCQVADHAFVATSAILNGNVKVGEQAFIGAGAIVRDGLTIAERSFIGIGAVVVADTEPDGFYVGNPARKMARAFHK